MKQALTLLLLFSAANVYAGAGMHMPERIHSFNFKHIELQSDSSAMVHMEAWHGDELEKFNWSIEWQKFDKHRSAEFSLGYLKAADAFWDTGPVAAVEYEREPGDSESEGWIGWQFKGTAPYFIHVDAKTLIGENEQLKVEVELEHEFPLGKHWLLETKLEAEAGRFEDAGDHDVELESWRFGWRVQYETVHRLRYYGGAEYTDDHHSDTSQWRAVAGIAYWW